MQLLDKVVTKHAAAARSHGGQVAPDKEADAGHSQLATETKAAGGDPATLTTHRRTHARIIGPMAGVLIIALETMKIAPGSILLFNDQVTKIIDTARLTTV